MHHWGFVFVIPLFRRQPAQPLPTEWMAQVTNLLDTLAEMHGLEADRRALIASFNTATGKAWAVHDWQEPAA